MPPKDPTVDYLRQSNQLLLANKVIHQQIKKLLSERQSIYQRVSKLRMQKREEEYNKAQREPLALSHAIPAQSSSGQSGQNVSPQGANNTGTPNFHSSYHNKRYRRTANEIERRFRCPVESCMKAYGCEGSLNQHIKIKHPGLYVPSQGKGQAEGEEYDSKGDDDKIDEESGEFSEQQ